jgi:hypothetical protein
VVNLFFAKKSLTKTNRCVGALPWRGNQLLVFSFSFWPHPQSDGPTHETGISLM